MSHVLASGVTGAAAVAGLHQLARHLLKDAPRLDVMGEKLIEKGFETIGKKPPASPMALSWIAGNLGSDTLIFALMGTATGKQAFARGAGVGALAGLAAVFGPKLLKVGDQQTARNPKMALTTIGLYVGAGLAAGAAKWVRGPGR